MIRSKPSTDEYREAWERVFGGGETEQRANTDSIECKIKSYLWHCKTCNALVSDPDNHQYHAVIVTEAPDQ